MSKLEKPVKLSSLDFDTNALQTLWIDEVIFPLLVSCQGREIASSDFLDFENENGSQGILYLCRQVGTRSHRSDLSSSASALSTLYQIAKRSLRLQRWNQVETRSHRVGEYHRSLKSNASFSKSSAHTIRSQSNHFFASVVTYIKLEVYRCKSHLNHFAQKAQLYHAALMSAFERLRVLQAIVPSAVITY